MCVLVFAASKPRSYTVPAHAHACSGNGNTLQGHENCQYTGVTYKGLPYIFLVALEDIPKDTELLTSYGNEYFQNRRFEHASTNARVLARARAHTHTHCCASERLCTLCTLALLFDLLDCLMIDVKYTAASHPHARAHVRAHTHA